MLWENIIISNDLEERVCVFSVMLYDIFSKVCLRLSVGDLSARMLVGLFCFVTE